MKLYLIEIANDLDDSIRPLLILSNEPLTKECDSLKSFIPEGGHVSACYAPRIIVNTWSEADFNEGEAIKKLLTK